MSVVSMNMSDNRQYYCWAVCCKHGVIGFLPLSVISPIVRVGAAHSLSLSSKFLKYNHVDLQEK